MRQHCVAMTIPMLLATLWAAFLAASPAAATTYVVRPNGTGDFATIQAAIDAAANGDVIELANGTFAGNGNRDLTYHGKAITVRAQASDPASCVIECGGSAGSPHRGFIFNNAETADAELEGVTIIHGYIAGYPNGRGGGIYFDNASPTIRRCVIEQNGADAGGGGICCVQMASPTLVECTIRANQGGNGGGIACWGTGNGVNGPSPAFTDCLITQNTAAASGGAIFHTQAGSPRFLRCRVTANSAGFGGAASFHLPGTSPIFTACTFYGNSITSYGGAIRSGDSASPAFDRCIIAGESSGSAIECMSLTSVPTFTCSDIFGNAGGNWAGCISSQAGVDGNISTDPGFCNPAAGDFTLRDTSPCAAANSPACGGIGALGVSCSGTPVVRVTWGRIKSSFRG
jgi:predicted outer membrane repeat protein